MQTNWRVKAGAFLVLTAFLASAASGNVVIDSKDWKDVYTGMYQTYENWDRGEPYFVTTSSASNILSGNTLPAGNVTIVQSSNPYSGGLEARLRSQPEDYNVREVINVDSASFDLIPEDQEDFIIVPSDYPAAAVVAGPLARVTGSWVLFVNENNIDRVSQVVQDAGNVMMIGSFSRSQNNQLTQYADERITSINAHNLSVQVAERFAQEKKFSEVMLSPAEELSTELFLEERPVLITKSRPPLSDSILNYVKQEKSIQTVFLANPEYSVVGSTLNDEVEKDGRSISVMVHFGQARGDQSSIYAPSLFPLPSGNLDLIVESVTYDPGSNQLVLTYRNPTEVKIFELTESLNVVDEEGNSIASAFDRSTALIDAESSRTLTYDVNLTSNQLDRNLSVQLTTTYGTNPQSREESLTNEGSFRPPYVTDLGVRAINDSSNVTIENVVYSKNLDRFKVKLRNTGETPAYATVNIRDVSVRGESRSFTDTSGKIAPGETETTYVAVNPPLDRIDIRENERVDVVLQYGKKTDLKLKQESSTVEFRANSGLPVVGSFSSSTTAGAAVLIVLLVLLAAIEYRTGKISETLRGVRE